MWVCSDCYNRLRPEVPVMKPFAWSVPLRLFYLGFLLMFVGVVLVMVAGLVSGGSAGFIWVLPFPPIILGVGWPYPVWVIMLSVALTVLGVVLFILFRKQTRKV